MSETYSANANIYKTYIQKAILIACQDPYQGQFSIYLWWAFFTSTIGSMELFCDARTTDGEILLNRFQMPTS